MRFVVVAVAVLTPAIAYAQWIPLPPQEPQDPSKPVDPWLPPPPKPPAPAPTPAPVEPPPASPAPTPPAPSTPSTSLPPSDPDEISEEELANMDAISEPADPADPADPAEPVERYPFSLPKRPLLLPGGTASFSASGDVVHVARSDLFALSSSLFLSGTIAVGSTELSATAAFTPLSTVDGPEYNNVSFPAIRSLSGSFRTLVGPELSFGAQLAWRFVGSEVQRFLPSVSMSKKAQLSDRAAILAGAGLEYESGAFSVPGYFNTPIEFRQIGAFGSIAVEAYVGARVSVLMSTSVEQHFHIDDVPMDYLTSYRTYLTRLALLVAASESVDVSFGFIVSSTGPIDTKVFTISFTARRLP